MGNFIEKTVHDAENYKEDQLRNFYEETVKVLKDNGKDVEDVSWVGDVQGNICMVWSDFKRLTQGMKYLPRGRCSFIEAEKKDGTVSYYKDEDGISNRIPVDLIISGNGWFMRRVVHTRVTASDAARAIAGKVYNESPEFWEFILHPERHSPFLKAGENDLRLFATDNIPMARTLVALNSGKIEGEELITVENMARNKLKASSRSGRKRRVGTSI